MNAGDRATLLFSVRGLAAALPTSTVATEELVALLNRAGDSLEAGDRVRAALEEALALRQPWPLRDAVAKLVEAAEHLLRDHACDRHGHEELAAAMHYAAELLPKIDNAQRVLLEVTKR